MVLKNTVFSYHNVQFTSREKKSHWITPPPPGGQNTSDRSPLVNGPLDGVQRFRQIHGHGSGRTVLRFFGYGRHGFAVPQCGPVLLDGRRVEPLSDGQHRCSSAAAPVRRRFAAAWLLLLRRVERGGRQQPTAADHHHRSSDTMRILRLLALVMLLLLLVLLVRPTAGHPETAKVHQPTGVRPMVLRLGTRQVAAAICTKIESSVTGWRIVVVTVKRLDELLGRDTVFKRYAISTITAS